jgi:hypothetical protein
VGNTEDRMRAIIDDPESTQRQREDALMVIARRENLRRERDALIARGVPPEDLLELDDDPSPLGPPEGEDAGDQG